MTDLAHPIQARPIPATGTLARNPYRTYIDSLDSPQSKRTMRGCLNEIARTLAGIPDDHWHTLAPAERDRIGASLDWHRLTYDHTTWIRDQLAQRGWSTSHVNKHLVALRRVLKEAWRLNLMNADDCQRTCDVKNLKGDGATKKPGRHVHDEEFVALLTACLAKSDLIGLRDAAMIAVLQSAGLRREELATARRDNYDPGERSLFVSGKGNRSREVYLHEVAAAYLGQWLAATEHITGPLFCPVNRWGTALDRHLSPDAVAQMLNARRLAAGLPKITAHDLRRTFAGALLDADVDLARVQQLMGHASATTTAGYDRRPGRQRRAAVDKLTLPRPEDLRRAD